MGEHLSEEGDWQEWRRLRAWELSQMGWKQRDIAAALNVTPGAVSQWLKRAREGGVASLRRRVGGGPPPRLSQTQLRQLAAMLRCSPKEYALSGDRWTNQRVVELVERAFQVRYHPSHVHRLLKRLGLSLPELGRSLRLRRHLRGSITGRSRLRRVLPQAQH